MKTIFSSTLLFLLNLVGHLLRILIRFGILIHNFRVGNDLQKILLFVTVFGMRILTSSIKQEGGQNIHT